LKKIFIGGSGRSGTTIALHVLYKHHQLYALPIESKFIVEVDGLSSLVNAMTSDFSTTCSQEAKERFSKLMREVVSGRGANPYIRAYGAQEFALPELFANYDQVVNAFLDKIKQHVFFEDRNELVGYARELTDALFGDKADELGKIGWCEKTPSNLSKIDFLQELYPDMYFINMIRDPRGVLHSLLRLGWCNPNIEIAATRLKESTRCLIIRAGEAENNGVNLLDVRWEELVSNTGDKISEITGFLEIEDYQQDAADYLFAKLQGGALRYDEAKKSYVDAWETSFSKDEITLVNSILGEEIEAMGYQL